MSLETAIEDLDTEFRKIAPIRYAIDDEIRYLKTLNKEGVANYIKNRKNLSIPFVKPEREE